MGTPLPVYPISCVQDRTSCRVPGNLLAGALQGSKGGPDRNPPPPIPGRAPGVYDLLPSGGARRGVPSGGVPGEGLKSDHPPGPLRAPPRARFDIGPGGGEPPPPVVPTVRHVCLMGGAEWGSYGHGDVCQGLRAKDRRRVEEEAHASTAADFQACGKPLEVVTSFKYLGRVLTASNNDWPVGGQQSEKGPEEVGEVP